MSLERKLKRDQEKKVQKLIDKEKRKRQVVTSEQSRLRGFKVICTECEKTYQMLNARDLKTTVNFDNRGIHKVHHDCPYCLNEHIVCYLNDELIELSQRLKAIKAIQPVSYHGKLTRVKRIENALSEYKQKLAALNDRMKPDSKVIEEGVGESTVNDKDGGI